jgi:hypothetical protein
LEIIKGAGLVLRPTTVHWQEALQISKVGEIQYTMG